MPYGHNGRPQYHQPIQEIVQTMYGYPQLNPVLFCAGALSVFALLGVEFLSILLVGREDEGDAS